MSHINKELEDFCKTKKVCGVDKIVFFQDSSVLLKWIKDFECDISSHLIFVILKYMIGSRIRCDCSDETCVRLLDPKSELYLHNPKCGRCQRISICDGCLVKCVNYDKCKQVVCLRCICEHCHVCNRILSKINIL